MEWFLVKYLKHLGILLLGIIKIIFIAVGVMGGLALVIAFGATSIEFLYEFLHIPSVVTTIFYWICWGLLLLFLLLCAYMVGEKSVNNYRFRRGKTILGYIARIFDENY
jgi:hypothetical protein